MGIYGYIDTVSKSAKRRKLNRYFILFFVLGLMITLAIIFYSDGSVDQDILLAVGTYFFYSSISYPVLIYIYSKKR